MLGCLIRLNRVVQRLTSRALTLAARAVERLWRAHHRRLNSHPVYATTVVAGAATLSGQADPLDLLAAVGAVLLAVYAATRPHL